MVWVFFDSFFLFSWKMFRSSPVFLVKNLGWSCHPKVWKLTKPQCCQCFFSSKNAAGVLSTAFGSKPAVWQSFELTLNWHGQQQTCPPQSHTYLQPPCFKCFACRATHPQKNKEAWEMMPKQHRWNPKKILTVTKLEILDWSSKKINSLLDFSHHCQHQTMAHVKLIWSQQPGPEVLNLDMGLSDLGQVALLIFFR